jgi:hypothetical protein
MTEMLRVAIVHYHLRPGGVTRVIEAAVAALSDKGFRTTVLAGETPNETHVQAPHHQLVEELAYGRGKTLSGRDLLDIMTQAAARSLGAAPDLWHFHNHSLGKNIAVPCAVEEMASRGMRLLLQIHDFPEDGRPGNYQLLLKEIGGGQPATLGRRLYPQGGHVHYAVLNGRDLRFLCGAGMPEEQVHCLPNPVLVDSTKDPSAEPPQERLFLYPSRAIRRKNIGEFIFWSALAEEGSLFAITRSPKNPVFQPVYEKWVRFAGSHELPVEFNFAAKAGLPFHSLVRKAHRLVTTSIAEGFGLGFLEPWLAGKALLGRKLPDITEQFEQSGLDLSGLYSFLGVPAEWIGRDTILEKIKSRLGEYLGLYGRQLKSGDVDRAFSAMVKDDKVDFGRLDEEFQETVIKRILESGQAPREIVPQALESRRHNGKLIKKNRETVRRTFNLETYGNRLNEIYHAVLNSDAGKLSDISSDTLLDRFLSPERFHLLRTT